MQTPLPSMNALRSFEAAARLHSISAAAQELFVTQGAVSKQIKSLEHLLGISLLQRTASGVAPTEQGLTYLQGVSTVLNQLHTLAESVQQAPQQPLVLDVIPSMTTIWLIGQIHSFERQHPHLNVDLVTGDGPVDLATTRADISIRCLQPSNAQGHTQKLLPERLLLVASPDLLARTPLDSTADIAKHKLIKQNTRPQMWDNFLQQHQVPLQQNQFGIGFQHFFMSLKAAQESLGLALVPDFLAASAIAEGSLVNPLQLSCRSLYNYYLFSPSYKAEQRKVQEFCRWLAGQFGPQRTYE
ncbi:MAG: LysR substrate-binding domain-containing protein [Pseudomonadales bacterium]